MPRSLLVTATCVWLATANLAYAAPPKVDFFFPAGGQQGQTFAVTASGVKEPWPAKTWVDRPGLTVEAGEKQGELKVTAAPDAAGVFWVRLYNAEGASAPRPFVVQCLPEIMENETNDDPQQPQTLENSCVVNGKLAKRGDVDGYALRLEQGQMLVASLLANHTLGSPMDGVLQICNADGFVLAQNDDERGLDPLLTYSAPREGVYLIRTFAFPAEPNSTIGFAGGDNLIYRLTIATGPLVDHTLPLAIRADESTELRMFGWNLPEQATLVAPPSKADSTWLTFGASASLDCAGLVELPLVRQPLLTAAEESSPQSAQPVSLPVVVSGRIESPKDADAFRFPAKKGQKISLAVESRSLGFTLDATLEVTDAEGKLLANEDDTGRSSRDPSLTFTAPADGEFQAVVRDVHRHGGLRYVYRLTIEEETPDYRLALAADSFTLAPGKPLEILVTIDRRNGFAGEIEIAAEGLPTGVTAAPVKSLGEGDTAKAVKLTLTAESGPASGPFTIVGQSGEDARLRRLARFTLEGLNAAHAQAWLTVEKPE